MATKSDVFDSSMFICVNGATTQIMFDADTYVHESMCSLKVFEIMLGHVKNVPDYCDLEP